MAKFRAAVCLEQRPSHDTKRRSSRNAPPSRRQFSGTHESNVRATTRYASEAGPREAVEGNRVSHQRSLPAQDMSVGLASVRLFKYRDSAGVSHLYTSDCQLSVVVQRFRRTRAGAKIRAPPEFVEHIVHTGCGDARTNNLRVPRRDRGIDNVNSERTHTMHDEASQSGTKRKHHPTWLPESSAVACRKRSGRDCRLSSLRRRLLTTRMGNR